MYKLLPYLTAIAAAVAVICLADSARAANLIFGDFEDFLFVSQDVPGNYNITSSSGQIHNGPTPDNGTGPDSPDDGDSDPQPTPMGYPAKPGGGTNSFGNWDRGGAGGTDYNSVNTGWGDWIYDPPGIFSASTTKGVTSGSKSLRMNPNRFGTSDNFTKHLSVRLQLMPDPLGDDAYSIFRAPSKYLAVDVTFDASEWTGTGSFVQLGMDYNQGHYDATMPLVDKADYQNLGAYHENTANPAVTVLRTPNYDTGNPGNPGIWDPTNFPGITTRTLYWDYGNWEAGPEAFGGQPGGPHTNTWYDLRGFARMPGVDGDNGWIDFIAWTTYSQGFTSGALYFDNWRFTSTPIPGPFNADFNNDGISDGKDLDILWNVVRYGSITDPQRVDFDYTNDGLVNEDDVDAVLGGWLTAGQYVAYGDANLSGGVPELTDYNLWRTGTGGWAGGDFDGSGGVPELNDFNLWHTSPHNFPGTVGEHGGGGGAPLVPEPSTIVLAGVGAMLLTALRRRSKASA